VPDWRASGLRRKRPAIARDDSMAAAAQATLRLHYVKMLAHEAGTRLGEDSEELHDMRVATRRMRMALRLFAPWLDAKTMRPALKGMRRTGRTLGAVRDLDVFHEKTQKYIEQLPARRRDELEPLLAAWRVEYRVRRGDLVAYLDGGRYRRFVEGLGELLDGPPERLASPAASTATVAQVLPGLLHHDLAEVLAAGSLVGGRETPLLRFHELRIAGKALRYTLEFFDAPLGRGVKPLIASMKELQDHLGDLQDAVVSSGILRDVITWGSWGAEGRALPGHTDVALAPGVARYLLARQEEMDRLVVTFPEVWPVVAGEEFGSRLARLLARLQTPPRTRVSGRPAGA
jgi:CHAD domain-containing protein